MHTYIGKSKKGVKEGGREGNLFIDPVLHATLSEVLGKTVENKIHFLLYQF